MQSDSIVGPNELFGHPKGLFVLFFTELWERFSYYGMRGLLIFYLTQHFLFSDEKSYAIYGSYTALVFLTPVLGGVLADRYLGARKAVIFGAILLVLGHAGMAFEGPPAISNPAMVIQQGAKEGDFYVQAFYFSLALIIAGVGFLKANISTIVGYLYQQDDPRRDSGFTIFYMGINIGAFSASLLCGYLGQTYGWSYGFGAAGLGMLFGLIVFLRGQSLLLGYAEPPDPKALKEVKMCGLSREWLIYIGTFFAVLIFWQLMQYAQWVGNVLGVSGLAVFSSIIYYAFCRCDAKERDRMLVAIVLIIMAVVFFALFEQAGSSLNLLADRHVYRRVFGMEILASQLQFLNPLFIFILAPLLGGGWLWLSRKGWEPSTPEKFSLGLFFVGFGFVVMAYGASHPGVNGKVSLVWLVFLYFLHTLGELCLSPVGLSMITKLSVKKIVGFMMGTWFLALSAANFIAAQIAKIAGAETHEGAVIDEALALSNTVGVYWNVGGIAIFISLFLAACSPLLKKHMHGLH